MTDGERGFELWLARDYEAAIPLFQRASEAGDAEALCHLGQAYLMGRGVKQDLSTAVDFFRRSAEAGYSGGQYWYGRCLEDGKGVEQNIDDAIVWFTFATQQDNRLAPTRLRAIGLAQPRWKRWLMLFRIPVRLTPADNSPDWPPGI